MGEGVLSLPFFQDGLLRLGDLWDSRTSTIPARHNIFGGELEARFMERHAVQTSDYRLSNIRSTSNKAKALAVSASVSIELAGGKIKLGGSASFDHREADEFEYEELLCQSMITTAIVRVSNGAVDAVSETVRESILSGETAATHFVKEISYGASLLGSFKYSRVLTESSLSLGGSLEGAFTVVVVAIPVTVGIKASLEMLDAEGNSNYTKSFSLETRPALSRAAEKDPTSAKELFDAIESFRLPENDDGVPLLFKLAPISDLIECSPSSLYKELEEDLLNKFKDMILTLHDFSGPGHVKSLLRARDERLVLFFKVNPAYPTLHPAAAAVVNWETDLAKTALEIKTKALNNFDKYKQGQLEPIALLDDIEFYETQFNPQRVLSKVEEHALSLRDLLRRVHFQDSAMAQSKTETSLFILEKKELQDYICDEQSQTRIVLQTGSEQFPPDGLFLRLYRLVQDLRDKLNIETRVAYPSTGLDFSLYLKVSLQKEFFQYELNDIPYVLDILEAITDTSTTKSLFYRAFCEAKNLAIGTEDIVQDPSLLLIIPTLLNGTLLDVRKLHFAQSYPQLRELLLVDSSRWNIVLPVQGLNSTYDVIQAFLSIQARLAQTPLSVAYIVGTFNSNLHDTPLLMLFRGNELIAVCVDYLELALFIREFPSSISSIPESLSRLSVLRPEAVANESLQPKRADFTLKVMSDFVSGVMSQKPRRLTSFNFTRDAEEPELRVALEMTQLACYKQPRLLLNAFAKLCVEENPGLAPVLRLHRWSIESAFDIQTGDLEPWRLLTEAVERYIETAADLQSTLSSAMDHLNEFLKLIKAFAAAEDEGSLDYDVYELCRNLLSPVALEDEQRESIQNAIKSQALFQAVCQLSKARMEFNLYSISNLFESQDFSLTDIQTMRRFIEKLGDEALTDKNKSELWSNSKIQSWLSTEVNNQVLLESICLSFTQSTVPNYIPQPFREAVSEALRQIQAGAEAHYYWPHDLPDLEAAVRAFQIIVTRGALPASFATTFGDNLIKYSELRTSMTTLDALMHWNNEKLLFDEPWDVDTVRSSLSLMMNRGSRPLLKPTTLKPRIKNPRQSVSGADVVEVSRIWQRFTSNGTVAFPDQEQANLLARLLPAPRVKFEDLEKSLETVLPYVLQHLLREDCSVLHSSRVLGYIQYMSEAKMDTKHGAGKCRLSKSDLITLLCNSSDSVLLTRVLQTMLDASMAVPIIVPDIRAASPGGFRDLTLLLRRTAIADLGSPGMDSRLFRHPYKCLLAIRVGQSRVGKSTFLNRTLMRDTNLFSCFVEPGAEHGPSLARTGFVEFSWMSPLTVVPELWEKLRLTKQGSELILVANLHGDALTEVPAVLEYIGAQASGLLVFWNASSWKDVVSKQQQLSKLLVPDLGQSHVFIDPDESILAKVGEQNAIRTHEVHLECTKQKLVNLVLATTRFEQGSPRPKSEANVATPVTLQRVPGVGQRESQELVDYVSQVHITDLKRELQQSDGAGKSMLLFRQMLELPLPQLLSSLYHLTFELKQRFDQMSRAPRLKLLALQRELKTLLSLNDPAQGSSIRRLTIGVRRAQIAHDELNLSTEVFFNAYFRLSDKNVEALRGLFLSGYTLQLPECPQTSGNSIWAELMLEVVPSIRVCVVSVLGARRPGKSTLLNGLFGVLGYKPNTTSSGKGVFVQLLHVHPELCSDSGFDALLVLDYEGLDPMQNLCDPEAGAAEIRLLTFLLGISNLVLVCSEAGSVPELVQCLESALLASSRIIAKKMLPELLVVHSEDAEAGELSALLTDALDRVAQLILESPLELGLRSRSLDHLLPIQRRLDAQELVSYIEPQSSLQKHSALYAKILEITNQAPVCPLLHDWYENTLAVWDEVVQIRKPLTLGSLAQIQVLTDEQRRCQNLKTLVAKAIDNHYVLLKAQLLQEMQENPNFDTTIFRSRIQEIPYRCAVEVDNTPCGPCSIFTQAPDLLVLASSVRAELELFIRNQRIYLEKTLRQLSVATGIQSSRSSTLAAELKKILEVNNQNEEEAWTQFQRYISRQKHVVPGLDQIEAEVKIVVDPLPHLLEHLPLAVTDIIRLDKFPAMDLSEQESMELTPYNVHSAVSLDLEASTFLFIQVEDEVASLLLERGAEKYQKQLVQNLVDRTTRMLAEFEENRGLKLLCDFKHQVYFAAISCLAKQIQSLENIWKLDYDPLLLLCANSDKFPNLFLE